MCIRFGPFGCELWGTFYDVDLGPEPGQTSTEHVIIGEVQDSGGAWNYEADADNGKVTIFVRMLI